MTQPISPDKPDGEELKALMWRCPHLTHEPSGICLGCGEQHEPLQSWLDTQNTRTPPPSALDEDVMRLEAACCRAEYEYPLLAAPDGTVAVQFADLRVLLTRLKDRGTD